MNSKNIIIAITGASGVIYGIRLLKELKKVDARSLLILSRWAKEVIPDETDYSVAEVEDMADQVYSYNDLAAPISSGSFPVRAMVIVPCTMTIAVGTAPHIGAAALAVAHHSLADPDRPSATVSTIQVPDHKDGLVAGPVAEQLARRIRRTVSVTAGIHIGPPDKYRASSEEIRKIIEAIPRMVEAILEKIK